MDTQIGWLILLVVGVAFLITRWRRHDLPATPTVITTQRLLKPRTPADCPACRQQGAGTVLDGPASLPILPWSEVKSRRGALW